MTESSYNKLLNNLQRAIDKSDPALLTNNSKLFLCQTSLTNYNIRLPLEIGQRPLKEETQEFLNNFQGKEILCHFLHDYYLNSSLGWIVKGYDLKYHDDPKLRDRGLANRDFFHATVQLFNDIRIKNKVKVFNIDYCSTERDGRTKEWNDNVIARDAKEAAEFWRQNGHNQSSYSIRRIRETTYSPLFRINTSIPKELYDQFTSKYSFEIK